MEFCTFNSRRGVAKNYVWTKSPSLDAKPSWSSCRWVSKSVFHSWMQFYTSLAKTEHKHWLKINIFSYYICLHANHNRTSKVPHIATMNKFYSCVSKAMLSFRLNKKEIQSQSDEHKWEVMPRMCLWQFLHFECFNTWEKENEKMSWHFPGCTGWTSAAQVSQETKNKPQHHWGDACLEEGFHYAHVLLT